MAAAVAASLLAGCYRCDETSCPTGCCSHNVCYDGTAKHGGVDCGYDWLLGLGGGGGSTGLGGGGGTMPPCKTEGASCTNDCCATNAAGAPLSCNHELCQRTDCVPLGDPCNASLVCCAWPPTSMLAITCKAEHCTTCYRAGQECFQSLSQCCPGLQCLLKSGFTSVYECR